MTTTYFQSLTRALCDHPNAIPRLIIDRDALDQNLSVLQALLPAGRQLRIVVKSLPAPGLIRYVMDKLGTQRLMVFHQPFLLELSGILGAEADILLGKPMPVRAAAHYYERVPAGPHFDPSGQLQWLIDTPQRAGEYLQLAQRIGLKLRLNLEIDVGLHRGGFSRPEDFRQVLQLIADHPEQLVLAGLMGYDPHVVKLPRLIRSPQRAFTLADEQYRRFVRIIQHEFPLLWREGLVLNGGGSPTLAMHAEGASVINEVAVGSALVKPTTFDLPTLRDFQPACFIATPILKKLKDTVLPGIEGWRSALSRLIPSYRRSYFIYGGYWRADYVYPARTKENGLFGSSTNQSMINMPPDITLDVGDYVFLRPQQSEFVLLQFGDLLVYSRGRIVAAWPVLRQ